MLPNGDVNVAEALFLPEPIRTVFDYAIVTTMQRAAAVGVSPNRITLLRDSDGDGVAETREVFLEGLNQPFGMGLLGDRSMSATRMGWLPSPTRRTPSASPRQVGS